MFLVGHQLRLTLPVRRQCKCALQVGVHCICSPTWCYTNMMFIVTFAMHAMSLSNFSLATTWCLAATVGKHQDQDLTYSEKQPCHCNSCQQQLTRNNFLQNNQQQVVSLVTTSHCPLQYAPHLCSLEHSICATTQSVMA